MKKLISSLLIVALVFSLIPSLITDAVIESQDDGRIKIDPYNVDIGNIDSFYTYEEIHDGDGKEIEVSTEGNEYVYENVLKRQMATIFDIQGQVNDTWQSTTYQDLGYSTVMRVNKWSSLRS